MSRYQQVRTSADDDHLTSTTISNGHSHIDNNNNNNNNNGNNGNNTTISTANRQQIQQQTDLEDTFGEAFDEDDDDTHHDESHRLLYPPAHSDHQFDSPSSQQVHRSPAVLPVRSTNDGVFSNMSAKPESESTKLDETPPTYDSAVADSTPPYWQTTVIAPLGMGDMILVEGMPVGSLFGFVWNLLVSATFGFVGFMLIYLLHTSHAGKNGARSGLGVYIIQFGLYIRSHGSLYSLDQEDMDDNSDTDDGGEHMNADLVAYFLMILGWFIILRSVADYLKAKNMEKIISTDPSTVIDQTV